MSRRDLLTSAQVSRRREAASEVWISNGRSLVGSFFFCAEQSLTDPENPMTLTRRSVLKSAALTAACSAMRPMISFAQTPAGDHDKQFHSLRVGACSYSLRAFPLAETLRDIERLGVHYLSLKEVHLPLAS